jgi:osmotically inducible protein OsmC
MEAVMIRKATALWQGNLKSGSGSISTESGVLKSVPYTFGMRFEDLNGTNPEELIAAAHAACFSMALSAEIEKCGTRPDMIDTEAVLTLDSPGGKWTITEILLKVKARVPGLEGSKFDSAVEIAKTNCPVSRLLKTKISVNAVLESAVPAR